MFKPKKEEQTQTTTASQTIVGQSVKLVGNFEGQDNVVIFGQVDGKIATTGDFRAEEGSKIKGNIEANNIFIAGTVEGSVKTNSRLEISPSGKVFGDIQAKSIVIAEGAVFCGQCQMEAENSKSQIPKS